MVKVLVAGVLHRYSLCRSTFAVLLLSLLDVFQSVPFKALNLIPDPNNDLIVKHN